jgi:hypothetical protein
MKTCETERARPKAGLAILSLWLILASTAAAQPASEAHLAFERFDQELKAAVRAENLAAIALLVHFPLRINHPGGGATSLDDPRALIAHFPEVFTPAVRREILETKIGGHIARSSEFGYGSGAVWAEQYPMEGEDAAFRIKVINLTDPQAEQAAAKELRLSFVCETAKHRITIEDRPADHSARYRVWNRPKSLLEKPDLEIADGVADMEGTGACATRFWKFRTGKVTIQVGELGCGPGDEPFGAVGDLVVTPDGGAEQSWYCF